MSERTDTISSKIKEVNILLHLIDMQPKDLRLTVWKKSLTETKTVLLGLLFSSIQDEMNEFILNQLQSELDSKGATNE